MYLQAKRRELVHGVHVKTHQRHNRIHLDERRYGFYDARTYNMQNGDYGIQQQPQQQQQQQQDYNWDGYEQYYEQQ
jgi:hypothetical protein